MIVCRKNTIIDKRFDIGCGITAVGKCFLPKQRGLSSSE